jgi:pyruvate/2-oxoglutarate/acetoin dehydrogenase E1 component
VSKYKDIINDNMFLLSQHSNAVFVGYNLVYGSKAYGTLANVPRDKILEMPVAEGLMTGVAVGMAMAGFLPILIFERHDFMLVAMDQLVNHLDKIALISKGEFKPKVIVRAIVGGTKPFDPGPQHSGNYTLQFGNMLKNCRLYNCTDEEFLADAYRYVLYSENENPVIIVEYRNLY